MHKLENIAQNEWVFNVDYPDSVETSFNDALDKWDAGNRKEAEKGIRSTLKKCPWHIDAWHHLSLIFDDKRDDLLAWACSREAVRLGLEVFPSTFLSENNRLLWGFIENRPFLRAYHTLGLRLLWRDDLVAAKEVFSHILVFNPNDNQGVRSLLMECYLSMQEWENILRLVNRYPNDFLVDIVYGKVLALLGLGREDEAIECLRTAIEKHPNVAKELLKSRHVRPTSRFPGSVSLGGEDEAYEYWESNKDHWAKNTRAYAVLKQLGAIPE